MAQKSNPNGEQFNTVVAAQLIQSVDSIGSVGSGQRQSGWVGFIAVGLGLV